MATFNHFDLVLPRPTLDSPLAAIVMELEHLRRLRLRGSTPAPLFFQLKNIFHTLESLGSARIEGNHTTLADYVESKVEGQQQSNEPLREIANIETAMDYVEKTIQTGTPITEQFIRELHAMTVESLVREGDKTPGAYRMRDVSIAKSEHKPPVFIQVEGYMQELVAFINADNGRPYDLIKVALAHHRFGWIHPFSNGNGRVVRLLTYALLIKYGFNVQTGGRVLNPTAVFCNDRDRYYAMLGNADTGRQDELESWCTYVLQGILDELRKVERLAQYDYLSDNIIAPAIASAKERGLITAMERDVLLLALKSTTGIVKASDLSPAMPGMTDPQRTYQIRKLVERKMLVPIKEGARQYTLGFSNSYLIRGIIRTLTDEGFIPATLNR